MDNRTIYYAPLPPKPATLIILERGEPIRLIRLKGDMRLGREDKEIHSDITLKSPIVSRNHGDFSYIDGIYYYKDNNSLNGTFLNAAFTEEEQVRIFDTTNTNAAADGYPGLPANGSATADKAFLLI